MENIFSFSGTLTTVEATKRGIVTMMVAIACFALVFCLARFNTPYTDIAALFIAATTGVAYIWLQMAMLVKRLSEENNNKLFALVPVAATTGVVLSMTVLPYPDNTLVATFSFLIWIVSVCMIMVV